MPQIYDVITNDSSYLEQKDKRDKESKFIDS